MFLNRPFCSLFEKHTFLIVMLFFLFAGSATAQNQKDFALANQLMQFGNYREAADIFARLYKLEPQSYPVFNRLVRCLTELKDYKEAIRITKKHLGTRTNDVPTWVNLGDLYYLSADTTLAMATWRKTLELNKNQPQNWRDVAEAMVQRKFFAEGEKIYLNARVQFKNSGLFMSELSNLYLSWGKYNKAAREWISLVESDPSKSAMLQRRMFRFEDDDYLDAFIVELEEAGKLQQPGTANYYTFRDLLIWLYSEKKMYRKALATARQLESVSLTSGLTPLLSLGGRLVAARQYALAEEAFLHYETANIPHIYKLSLEERARLYKQWGDDIRSNEAGTSAEANEKFKKSLSMLDKWKERYGENTLPPDLAILFIHLTIDQFKDPVKAQSLLNSVRKQPEMQSREGELMFLEGRIYQINGDFPRARVSFNRSLKSDPLSELGERSRYYLGLTDFFSTEFEFCSIQLRALERLSSSFYANDAIRLRTWIQESDKSDSLKSDLKKLARAQFLLEKGAPETAMDSLKSLVISHKGEPVAGFALQVAADFLSTVDIGLAVSFLNTHLPAFSSVPNAERLLWLQARLSELTLTAVPPASAISVYGIPQPPQLQRADVAALYENLLMKFPSGFYAQQVRERLLALEKEISL